jgi:CRISPR-associated protein Csd1
MSWMQKLYETYENCSGLVGKVEQEGMTPLLPIYHMTVQAQIEAVIDITGQWVSARVLEDKQDRTTLIPCTEKSASRAGTNAVPHPLFDKLIYLAGDYTEFRNPKEEHYTEYMKQLSDWCDSPFGLPQLRAVRDYLRAGRLMKDLIGAGVLFQDPSGALPEKWSGNRNAAPPIFGAVTGDQASAFVRFRVVPADGSEDLHSRIWLEPAMWNSYIDYRNSLPVKKDFCYVLGKKMPVSELSPRGIRYSGDKAKLISSNDNNGFTYRGRFETAAEAFCIGSETTEKAHNALKWLIASPQAYVNGGQVILSWLTNNGKSLNLCQSSLSVLAGLEPDQPAMTTGEEFAHRFRNALRGYGGNLSGGEQTCILGLDSATKATGRLSIFYYREIAEKDLVDRVSFWHETCRWHLRESLSKKKGVKRPDTKISFIGAPSPEAIAEAAYGKQVSDPLKKSTVQRLLPCIADAAELPPDIMRCAARRASNPPGLDKDDDGQTLTVACALIRKYYNDQENRDKNRKIKNPKEYKERWKMALDPQETNRDYLFGRALAYAQQLESYALSVQGEKRSTNAERMQAAFSRHPAKTWKTLYQALTPYLIRLGRRGFAYREELNEVISKIEKQSFTNEPLSELYLLGYACQMQKFREERETNMEKKNAAAAADMEGEETE